MLVIQHLNKAFGRTKAVDDLSFTLKHGEILGLLGPNGAGKTTTISMITGLLRQDQGNITIHDTQGQPIGPPTNHIARQRLGVCPQQLSLYNNLTAAENILFFARLAGLSKKHAAERQAHLLDQVSLTDRAHHRVKTFSGGMKRRLSIACALAHNPNLLLLDEPTAGVDPHSRTAILDHIQTLRTQGKSILYTTHYMEEAERICDRVAIIDRGKLLAIDTVPALVQAHGGTSTIRVTTATNHATINTEDPIATIRDQQLLEKSDTRSISIAQPNLEAVFLALTGRSLRDE